LIIHPRNFGHQQKGGGNTDEIHFKIVLQPKNFAVGTDSALDRDQGRGGALRYAARPSLLIVKGPYRRLEFLCQAAPVGLELLEQLGE
jgi:hypothetical protein